MYENGSFRSSRSRLKYLLLSGFMIANYKSLGYWRFTTPNYVKVHSSLLNALLEVLKHGNFGNGEAVQILLGTIWAFLPHSLELVIF